MDKNLILAKIAESRTVITTHLPTMGLSPQQLNKADKEVWKVFENLEKRLFKVLKLQRDSDEDETK